MTHIRKHGKLVVGLLAAAMALTAANAFAATILADKIGVAHTDGNYSLTSQPFLVEGAQQIRQLGSRVIKVFLQDPARKYPHNSSWPAASDIPDIVDVLQTPDFQTLFNMDFNTFILQAHLDTVDDWYWYDGLNDSERELVMLNYYDAAKYLLQRYAGTGKRFILEHWEADLYFKSVREAILASGGTFDNATAQQGLLDYFDARAEGVRRARDEAKANRLEVLTAVELIWISSHTSEVRLIDRLEEVRADRIAYSMSEECTQNIQAEVENIQTLIQRAGGRPFYIGEFAAAEARFSAPTGGVDTLALRSTRQEKAMLAQIDAALNLGAEFVCLWQIYNNGTDYADSEGYGLIRRDGTKTALAQAMPTLLTQSTIPTDAYASMEQIAGLSSSGWPQWMLNSSNSAGAYADSAVVTLSRALDVTPGAGLVMHTSRVPGGRTGDTHADPGETVTLWADTQVGMPLLLIADPLIPSALSRYSDNDFLWDNGAEDEDEPDDSANYLSDNDAYNYEDYGTYSPGYQNGYDESSDEQSMTEKVKEMLSGGCNTGFGLWMLLPIGLLALRRPRKGTRTR